MNKGRERKKEIKIEKKAFKLPLQLLVFSITKNANEKWD